MEQGFFDVIHGTGAIMALTRLLDFQLSYAG
jgi:hypothetical protein